MTPEFEDPVFEADGDEILPDWFEDTCLGDVALALAAGGEMPTGNAHCDALPEVINQVYPAPRCRRLLRETPPELLVHCLAEAVLAEHPPCEINALFAQLPGPVQTEVHSVHTGYRSQFAARGVAPQLAQACTWLWYAGAVRTETALAKRRLNGTIAPLPSAAAAVAVAATAPAAPAPQQRQQQQPQPTPLATQQQLPVPQQQQQPQRPLQPAAPQPELAGKITGMMLEGLVTPSC